MKKLLCIIGQMNAGGAETFVMKIYRALDRSKYQIDFCVSGDGTGFYDTDIQEMGGQIHHITRKTKNFMRYARELETVVKKGNYKRVIRIGDNCFCALDLWLAFLAGAKIRIMRSSNSAMAQEGVLPVLHKILRVPMTAIANKKIAPSYLAGQFTFGKHATENGKVHILKNGLNTYMFRFDEENRKKIRREMGAENVLLVGHIGRFSHQKNHNFLVEVFFELKKLRLDAKLVLVGDGELMEDIKKKIDELSLKDDVVFTGVRSDVSDILSALDVLIFPSYYEGMPNVIIEAQTNGLPCLVSDMITKEVKVTDVVAFASLDEEKASWAKKAVQISQKVTNRAQYAERMRKHGYEIADCTKDFVELVFGRN